jgi:hypothetical protein
MGEEDSTAEGGEKDEEGGERQKTYKGGWTEITEDIRAMNLEQIGIAGGRVKLSNEEHARRRAARRRWVEREREKLEARMRREGVAVGNCGVRSAECGVRNAEWRKRRR